MAGSHAARAQDRLAPQSNLGELSSNDSISYRIGAGSWLRLADGAIPVVMPLQVRARKSHCKLALPPGALFEATRGSDFALDGAAPDALSLRLTTGSILYALAPGARLQIARATGDPIAEAGAVAPADATAVSIFSEAAHIGVVQINRSGSVAFYNVKGRLEILDAPDRRRAVTAGGVGFHPEGALLASPIAGMSGDAADPRDRALFLPDTQRKARPVGAWWALPEGPMEGDGPAFVFSPEIQRQVFMLPQVRYNMSPVMPPPRHRGDLPPATGGGPGLPPARRR